jgi:hypothetical protein
MSSHLRRLTLGLLLSLAPSLAHAIVPLSIFPNPVQLATVAQGSSSSLSVNLTNVTTSTVVITSTTIIGSAAADYSVSNGFCTTLFPNENCTISVTFTPVASGNRSATLQIGVQGLNQKINVDLQGTGGSPAPTLTSLSPANVYANGPTLTLTLNGTNFVSGSIAYFSFNPLTTTFVSSTQLTAVVPASDIGYPGSDYVEVVNPDGSTSTSILFNIVGLDPSINSASPTSLVSGSAPSPVILTGGNFMSGATVLWNGKAQPTTYLNVNQIQFTPTKAQLAAASIAQLSVSNPAPGGISPTINFDVTYPAKVTVLDLPANDIVWDPFAQRIYASLPSSYGTNGNTIAVINPTTARVTGYFFAGSEPNQLALSADSSYLYVGLNGNGSVQRMLLPAFTPDINVSLGSGEFGGLNTALDLQVSPSDPHTFAVSEGTSGCCGLSGLYFFKDASQLPNFITYPYVSEIQFANSSTLYGYYNDSVTTVAVDSNGGTAGQTWTDLVEGNTFAYANGLLYGSAGEVLNPATGLLTGSYDINGSCCGSSDDVLPLPSLNRVLALGTTPFFSQFSITSYNQSKFTAVAVLNMSQLSGTPSPSFIRWGNNGVAFILDGQCCSSTAPQIVLVQSPSLLLASSTTKNPVPSVQSLAPGTATHGSGNFTLSVTGTGFVPGSQVTLNGASLTADYVSATQLNVYVAASDIATAGAASIVVTNPAPGGGSSTPSTLTIN